MNTGLRHILVHRRRTDGRTDGRMDRRTDADGRTDVYVILYSVECICISLDRQLSDSE